MKIFPSIRLLLAISLFTCLNICAGELPVNLQRMLQGTDGQFLLVNRTENWKAEETAIVICDMWDRHWCPSATANVMELAPAMDRMLDSARAKGITVIHAPSSCMDYYKDYPQRRRMERFKSRRKKEIVYSDEKLPSEKDAKWPVELYCEGCMTPGATPYEAWTKETDLLTICEEDLISDSGNEIEAYLRRKGIKNVILCGVHTNMCIVNRSFGLRSMKKKGFNVALMRDMTDLMYDPATWPYTTHFGGLRLMVEYIEKYICPTIVSSDITGRDPFVFKEMLLEKKALTKDRARDIRLPESDYHLKAVDNFVEREPDEDYLHAPEAAYKAFKDIKFSVRIHWGIYSIWQMNGESWGFLNLPDSRKQEYNELYKSFNPTDFDADGWMDLFKRSGLQAFAFTTKHHEGFSMFDTRTRVRQRAAYSEEGAVIEDCDLAYSIMETPFRRDVVKELTDAARKRGIKIDLYYSHPDWYDADFRPYNNHPLTTPSLRDNTAMYGNDIEFDPTKTLTPERTPEETARMVARHREQLRELMTNYGRIDMLCLDQWLGADVWEETKATIKMVRQLQPDIMIRCRGIGNYGDFYTPERFVPGSKENTGMPWMVIYPLASSFSYDKEAKNYKGAEWIVENLTDAVSKGGSFMVGIGPDGTGKFHPEAVAQLEETGKWLSVNGEAIFGTIPRREWKEGGIRFTLSKDGRYVYAFVNDLSTDIVTLSTVSAKAGTTVCILGCDYPVEWEDSGQGLTVRIPEGFLALKKSDKVRMFTIRIE